MVRLSRSLPSLLCIAALQGCGGAQRPMPAPVASPAPSPAPVVAEAPASVTPAPPSAPVKVRSLGGIDEYLFANGLRVLLFPDPSQSTLTVNITYLVGSRHEGYGETGMAHLLEHMLFKGTPTHRNVMKLLDARGAFFNGSTWNDRTNYYETLNATDDNLRWALGLEADRMINASITPEDLSTEFSVVRNELELGENNPVAILEERVTSTAYLWHNYGKSTIGSRSDVEGVPVERLRAFYVKHYQPDNAVLVIAGKFEPATALGAVASTFGVIPRPNRTLPPTYTVEPVQDGEREVTLRRTGDVHVLMAGYHGVGAADPDHVAFRALSSVLTDEPSGRLYRSLVAGGLAADVWASFYAFRDPGLIIFGAKPRDARSVAKVKATLLTTLEGLSKQPITADELERWRAQALKDWTLALSDSQDIAIELSEWAAAGDWRLLFADREAVQNLRLDAVNRVAQTYLIPSNRTFGEFIPTKDPVRAPAASTPDAAATVDKLATREIVEGEAFAVDLDNLAKRTQFRTLAGGLEAAFVPRKTRGAKVTVQLLFRHGDEKSLTGKTTAAELTGELVGRGTRRLSHQAVQDTFDKLTADVSVSGGAGWVLVRISTVKTSLPAVIDVVAELLKRPALDGKELEVVRRQILSELEGQLTEPDALAFNAMARAVSPWPAGHPKAVMSVSEELAAVKKAKLADVRAYHAGFYGAGKGEVAAVGDFDADALAAQLEKHFGAWTSKTPFVRIPDKAFGVPGGESVLDTRDKEMAIVVGSHDIAVDDTHADAPALTMASRIFGGGAGSRLWLRLREKEGFSYGTWGYAVPGDDDPVGQVGFGAILAPQNAATGRAALMEEMKRLVADGITADELATGKKALLEQQDNILADEDALVRVLRNDRYLGRDWSWWKTRRAALAAMTEADVERAVTTWFHPDRMTIVTAGDQQKAAGGNKPKP